MENEKDPTKEVSRQHQSKIINYEKPTFLKAGAKMAAGVGGYYAASYFYDCIPISTTGLKIALGIALFLPTRSILWEGFSDLIKCVSGYIYDTSIEVSPNRPIILANGQKKSLRNLNKEEHDEQKYLKSIRNVKLVESMINTISNLINLNNRFAELYWTLYLGISPFAFYSPNPQCLNGEYLHRIFCYPITNTVSMPLFTAMLAFNIRELYCQFKGHQIENDPPFKRFFNGHFVINVSWIIYQKFTYSQRHYNPKSNEIILQETSYPLSAVIHTILEAKGFSDFYMGTFGIFSNTYTFLKEQARASIVAQLFEDTPSRNDNLCSSQNPPPVHLKKLTESEKDTLYGRSEGNKNQSEITVQTNEVSVHDNLSVLGNQNIELPLLTPKTKEKTKGKPRKQKHFASSNSKKEVKGQKNHTDDPEKEKARRQGLERVKELRKQSNQRQIKVTAIENELNKLVEFLHGKILPVEGSKFKLEWTLSGKKVGITYEIPHGIDHTKYRGDKLKSILNVLEIGYLVGLDQEGIDDYLRLNQKSRLEKLSKFLFYVLATRPNLNKKE